MINERYWSNTYQYGHEIDENQLCFHFVTGHPLLCFVFKPKCQTDSPNMIHSLAVNSRAQTKKQKLCDMIYFTFLHQSNNTMSRPIWKTSSPIQRTLSSNDNDYRTVANYLAATQAARRLLLSNRTSCNAYNVGITPYKYYAGHGSMAIHFWQRQTNERDESPKQKWPSLKIQRKTINRSIISDHVWIT